MGRKSKHQTERERLMAMVPKDAVTIQVRDEFGHIKYRDRPDLADNDEIQVNKKGDPIVTMAKLGRRLNDGVVELEPVNDAVAELMKQKQETMDRDPIIETAKKAPESTDLLHYVMMALAEEAASIGFERQEAERQGLETSNISTRRINALKTVVDTWLKRKDQVTTKDVDLKSLSAKALFEYIFEMFRDAMETSGIVPEMTETIFSKVAKTLDSDQFENEAKNRMKNAN